MFTGFDSAWGKKSAGAVCDLTVVDGKLSIARIDHGVYWENAYDSLMKRKSEHHWIGIDMPLIVTNPPKTSRAVDQFITRKLMGTYKMGAHVANLSKSMFQPTGDLAEVLKRLKEDGYSHVNSGSTNNKLIMEVFPGIALIGWLNYKCNYKVNKMAQIRKKKLPLELHWDKIFEFFLNQKDLPIVGGREFLENLKTPNKRNEDMLDAFIAAYSVAWFWKFGLEGSMILGDLQTGYVVTPVTPEIRAVYTEA